jgi:hypothetical protein
MISSHGVIQGYNANAMVDGKNQVIVHAQAFGEGEDAKVAGPMLEGAERNLKDAGVGDEPLMDTWQHRIGRQRGPAPGVGCALNACAIRKALPGRCACSTAAGRGVSPMR